MSVLVGVIHTATYGKNNFAIMHTIHHTQSLLLPHNVNQVQCVFLGRYGCTAGISTKCRKIGKGKTLSVIHIFVQQQDALALNRVFFRCFTPIGLSLDVSPQLGPLELLAQNRSVRY